MFLFRKKIDKETEDANDRWMKGLVAKITAAGYREEFRELLSQPEPSQSHRRKAGLRIT